MGKNKTSKKKKIIYSSVSGAFLVLVIVCLSFLSVLRKPSELNTIGVNTIYTGENEEKEEESRFEVNYNLKNENENNELVNQNEENNQPSQEKPMQKPKVKESPYYIKVNNQANVVTVYKKDDKR